MMLLKQICSNELETRIISVSSKKITNRIRLALITDLHSSRYGDKQSQLVSAVRHHGTDAVLYAGDIFDSRQSDDAVKELFSGLSDYPSWFVTGNHEYKHTDPDKNRETVRSYGIKVLQGDSYTSVIGGQKIVFSGTDDSFSDEDAFEKQLKALDNTVTDAYRVFLLHNPETDDIFNRAKTDLMVCGHVHGGQWRLPFMNRGLVSPKKTLFPKYSSGYYKVNNIDLVVSRGLSTTSTSIPRIFNRPEIIFVDVCPSHENI